MYKVSNYSYAVYLLEVRQSGWPKYNPDDEFAFIKLCRGADGLAQYYPHKADAQALGVELANKHGYIYVEDIRSYDKCTTFESLLEALDFSA